MTDSRLSASLRRHVRTSASTELVLDRGEDVCDLGHRRQPLPRRHREPLVRQRRPRAPGDRRRRDRSRWRRLEAYSAFGDFTTASRRRARRPAVGPRPDGRTRKVFLASGGGDAIDTAAKLARRYWQAAGEPQRVHLISRINGYHGTHGFGTSLAGIEANRAGFGVSRPRDELRAARRRRRRWPRPSSAWGRSTSPPSSASRSSAPAASSRRRRATSRRCAALCERGRRAVRRRLRHLRLRPAGHVVRASSGSALEPDMITFAKGVTSGYLPLGGVAVSGRVAAPFWDGDGAPIFRHGATYAAHATCCAAGLANLDILEREGLIPRGRGARGRPAVRPGAAGGRFLGLRGARRHGPARSGRHPPGGAVGTPGRAVRRRRRRPRGGRAGPRTGCGRRRVATPDDPAGAHGPDRRWDRRGPGAPHRGGGRGLTDRLHE